MVILLKATGINRGTITRLYQETAVRVEFDVLEQLCLYLGCEVGELLELPNTSDKGI
jgi:putative transcriptional regulator